jgi:MYXO-CTERM domain-containing protein
MRKMLFPLGALAIATSTPAYATVTEPDGTALPQPVPSGELSVITSRGFLATDDTLNGLFAIRGEKLDQSKDAHQTPGTFSPQCGFTGQIVLHGGGCANALGWYNATPGSMTPPPAAQIYSLVPANLKQAPPNGISCTDGDFCPMAEPNMDPNQAGQHTWVTYTWNASQIASNPNYKGGQVGFALIGNSGQCSQTKYSEAQLNVVSTQYKVPWVTTLIYQSTVDPSSYYIAFEDLPMDPMNWKQYGCDGDFNDFVFYVTGLNCQGGGVDCDTGMPGVCAGGTTQCSSGGMNISCVSNIKPSSEICNGLDDDCDGTVDNPDAPGLCPTGFVCSQGQCLGACTNSEFPCNPPTECDKTDQLCKDPACIGVTCGAEQTCYQGSCIGGCNGVICPPGQVCRIGSCVDPCDGVKCSGSTPICDNGACVPPCSCRPCAAGQTCSSKGNCVDNGCDKLTCKAPQVCVKGACVDACAGVVCPLGQQCNDGECAIPAGGPIVPHPDAGMTTGTGGVAATGGVSGTGGVAATGGTTGAGGYVFGTGGSSPGTGGAPMGHPGGIQTCSCDASGPGAGGLALMLAAVAFATTRRRRRS